MDQFLEFYKKLLKWAGVENSDTFVKDFEESIKNKKVTPSQLTKIMKKSKNYKDFESKVKTMAMKFSTDTTGVGVRRDSIKTKTTEIQDYKKEIGNKYENINDIDLIKQLKGL